MNGFESFIGNDRMVVQIKKMLAENTLPHAVVIAGKAGSGKKTLAGIIAAALVCENPVNGEPCGMCMGCKKSQTGHPDILYVNGEEDKTFVAIKYIRNMRLSAYQLPNEARRKVYIITKNMQEPAQNALLKVLEEPPETTTFIILCQSKNDLLPTVLSRSTVFELGGVDINEGTEYLSKLYPDVSRDILRSRLEDASGNLGEAITLTKSRHEDDAFGMAERLANALSDGDRIEFLAVCSDIVAQKYQRQVSDRVLNHLSKMVHNAIVAKYSTEDIKKSPAVEKMSYKIDVDTLMKYHELLDEVLNRSELNPNLNLTLTVLCSGMFE